MGTMVCPLVTYSLTAQALPIALLRSSVSEESHALMPTAVKSLTALLDALSHDRILKVVVMPVLPNMHGIANPNPECILRILMK
jgi:hypothetical protein